jgi:hypothetical protein
MSSVCVLLAAVSFNSPAQAACIEQPYQQAPEGAHWSLYYDRVENRRCWMLIDAAGRDISMFLAQPAARPAPPSLQTIFGNFTGGPPPPPPPPQQPPVAARPDPPPRRLPARVVHANRPGHPVRRTAQRGEAHPDKHEMTPEEREALFKEFLRWHESQQTSGGVKPPSPPR